MNLEFKLSNRNAVLKELKREGNIITISVDDVIYEVDLIKVKNNQYSVLHQGKSTNVEVFEKMEPKQYTIRTATSDFDVEVIDIESRYMQNRNQVGDVTGDSIIRAPMPGKVVSILVQTGDQVEAGQTVVILSAMKMESEFKAGKSGIVTEVGIKEGDTVESNQVMVVIEEVSLGDE
jgi:biotin carboxyl carrier protein